MIAIGLEASSLCRSRRAGIQHYIANFVDSFLASEAFKEEFSLKLLYKLSRFRRREFRYRVEEGLSQWYYPHLIPIRNRFKLVHCLDRHPIPWKSCKRIATIYDIAVLRSEHDGDWYSSDSFRKRSREKTTKILEYSDAVVTLSESTKKDILEYFDYSDEDIHVIPSGVHASFLNYVSDRKTSDDVLSRHGLTRNGYFLFVGGITLRKNVSNLIQAYARSDTADSIALALAGEFSEQTSEIMETVRRLKLDERVKFLRYVSDSDLPHLYANARAFLFPTYYEGFGIPILEAMACRTPVLVGNRGAAPEVAGGYAVTVDPFEVDDIAIGIQRVLETSPESVEEAFRHASQFTWAASAERTASLYREVLNG
ncbi:MAG: glycosyltransferase family 4 protein [Candidatus Hydrogenedentes bacterium]|nr:glycosyltransferase family 4 protein [Candidatus Hydrogenedentota bacterium]